MKVIVFGASGLTGTALVAQAREQGLAVTAFVRSSSKPPAVSGVQIKQGDVRALDSVVGAMAGHDAALIALGSGTLGRSDLLRCASANIIAAMRQHGMRRIIALGAAGALPDADKNQSRAGRVFFRVLTRTLLKNVLRDQADMEKQIADSGLDYTIVRPAALTNAAPAGTYRLDAQALPAKWKPISRSDVAAFMLKQLNDPAFMRTGVYISR